MRSDVSLGRKIFVYECFSFSLTWDSLKPETVDRRAKINSISAPWGGKRVYVELWSMAKFHAKYGNVGNQSVSRKPLTEERNKLNFYPLG